MNRNYFYIILAFTIFCLLLIAIFFIRHKEEAPVSTTDPQSEQAPFNRYISGIGIVEPQSGNIQISSPYNRRIETIFTEVNDKVKKGDLLFQLNNQDYLSDLKIKEKKYESTLAHFQKLEGLPLEEDVTIAMEALNKKFAFFNEAKGDFEMNTSRKMSQQQWYQQLYKYQQAEAEFREAQAQFEKVKSGTSKANLNIAYHEVEEAQAAIDAIKAEIDQTGIKSPIDGTVLQVKIHQGETATPNKTALILGNIDQLNLRVSMDQFLEQMFHKDSCAMAFREGDLKTQFPLEFIRAEPVMSPKMYLNDSLRERVDTLVFEILYRIKQNDSPLLIGEQMDVYIEVQNEEQNGG